MRRQRGSMSCRARQDAAVAVARVVGGGAAWLWNRCQPALHVHLQHHMPVAACKDFYSCICTPDQIQSFWNPGGEGSCRLRAPMCEAAMPKLDWCCLHGWGMFVARQRFVAPQLRYLPPQHA